MARRVDDVDAMTFPLHRSALGQNGDAALALQIVGVHGALVHMLIVADGAGLFQQLIDQRGLAVVDVSNNGDVTDIHGDRRVRERALIDATLRNRKQPRSGPAGILDAPFAIVGAGRAPDSARAGKIQGFLDKLGRRRAAMAPAQSRRVRPSPWNGKVFLPIPKQEILPPRHRTRGPKLRFTKNRQKVTILEWNGAALVSIALSWMRNFGAAEESARRMKATAKSPGKCAPKKGPSEFPGGMIAQSGRFG